MRPAKVVIDLAALRHNLAEAERRRSGSRIVAVVKANAYGHGAARVLPALTAADMLGVACIEEALSLRQAGATQPILLLEGVFEADELPWCARLGFEVVVHEPGQVRMLELARLERPLATWLKVDSGMGRLGFRLGTAPLVWRQLTDCAAVAPGIRLMSHFANADEPGNESTAHQLARLHGITPGPDRDVTLAAEPVARTCCCRPALERSTASLRAMFERWYRVSPTTTRPPPSVLASHEHPKVLHALHERSVAFAKYSLAACIKGALELQGFPVGPPLPPQQPLGSAGRQEVREVSNVLERSAGRSNPDHEDRDRGVRACRL